MDIKDKKAYQTQLIKEALNGDQSAYTKILDICRGIVILTVNRMIKSNFYREEVIQKSFIKICKNLPQYDSEKGMLTTWATKLTVNNCIDCMRDTMTSKRDMSKSVSLDVCYEDTNRQRVDITENVSAEDIYTERETHELRMAFVNSLVSKMSSLRQEVFKLRFNKDLSYKEISEELDIPISSVKSYLNRIKSDLKEGIKEFS